MYSSLSRIIPVFTDSSLDVTTRGKAVLGRVFNVSNKINANSFTDSVLKTVLGSFFSTLVK